VHALLSNSYSFFVKACFLEPRYSVNFSLTSFESVYEVYEYFMCSCMHILRG